MQRSAWLLLLAACSGASASPPVVIEATYPGANAEIIANVVVAPLEAQLKGTPGVARMRSLALDGVCRIRLDLEPKADLFKVRAAVGERIALAQPQLPQLAQGVTILAAADEAFLLIALRPTDKADLTAVSKLAEETLRKRLRLVPLVSDVQILGDQQERLNIRFDREKLQAHGLSPLDVLRAVEDANISVAIGKIGQPPKPAETPKVKQPQQPPKTPKFENLVVADKGGKKVFLTDVASVVHETVRNDETGIVVREDRKLIAGPAVLLVVQMLPGGVKTAPKNVDKVLAELADKIPAGVRIDKRLFVPADTTIAVRLADSASLDRRTASTRTAAEKALGHAHVQAVFWVSKRGERDGLLYIAADAGKTVQVRAELRKHLDLPDAVAHIGTLRSPTDPWPGDGMAIVVRVWGEDRDALRKTADQVQERLAKLKGIVDLDSSSATRSFLTVHVDREKCAKMGVRVGDVAQALQLAHDGVYFNDFNRFGKSIAVTVMKKRAEDLGATPIRNEKGDLIPLAAVAKVVAASAPAFFLRDDGVECLIVAANVHGRDADETRKEVNRVVSELTRKGVRVEVEKQRSLP